MSGGRVRFVGCGPGAPDLLTVRAVRALGSADIVIWNDSLLARDALAEHVREDAEIVRWPPATRLEILDAYDRARAEGLLVVRLTGGDPTLFGALESELSAVLERGLGCEIVPGVSAFTASAAALVAEAGSRAAPLLLVDAVALCEDALAEPPALAVYGANRDPRALQRALLERGLDESTPCAVALEVSRPDEAIVACTLAELAETIEDIGLGVLTLVLAGPPAKRFTAPETKLETPGNRDLED